LTRRTSGGDNFFLPLPAKRRRSAILLAGCLPDSQSNNLTLR
jgi:hypothetical protein